MLFSFRGNRNGTTRNTKPRLLACVSLHSACLHCSFLYGLRLWLHIAKRRLELFERYCSSLCIVDRLCNLTNLLLLVVPLLLSSSFSFLSLLHWPCLFSSLSLSLPSPPAFSSLVHSSCPCFRRALHLVDVSVMIVVGFGKLHVINWQTWLPFGYHLVRCVSVKHVCCMCASALPHNKPYCRLLDDFPEEIWIWCIGIHSSQRNLLCGVHYSLQGTVRCDWKRELDQDSGEWIIGDHIADDWQMEYDCLNAITSHDILQSIDPPTKRWPFIRFLFVWMSVSDWRRCHPPRDVWSSSGTNHLWWCVRKSFPCWALVRGLDWNGELVAFLLHVSEFINIHQFFYAVNLYVSEYQIGGIDVGGSIFIHTFGAYFGLSLTMMVSPRHEPEVRYGMWILVNTLFATSCVISLRFFACGGVRLDLLDAQTVFIFLD